MSDPSVPPGGHRSGRGPRRSGGSRSEQGRSGGSRGEQGGSRGGQGRSGPPRGRSGPRGSAPSRPPSSDPAREAALDTLRAVRADDAYANLVLPRLLRERRITGRDASLATELAYGASRARGLLDAVLAACCDRPLDALDGEVLDVLRLGAQQLLRSRIPPHAAVGAAVDLVRGRAGSRPTGFVNAVLRRVGERDEAAWVAALAPDAEQDPVGHLAFVHPHPRWIAEALADALGPERAAELDAALAADDRRPAVHLAARPGEVSAEELAAMTGGDADGPSPYGVTLLEGGDPAELEPVQEGLAAVQDQGSQLVACALTRAELDGPDTRWLDLCAGPGGKTVLLGALGGLAGARVDAVDRAAHRVRLVEQATAGLDVRTHTGDARTLTLPEPAYDRVLVDAPCSGLGALRRRPEARWRRGPDDVAALAVLQRELLAAALERTRPGGVVVYATCSPHRHETTDVVAAVIADGAAEPLDTVALLPEVTDAAPAGDGPGMQLWPHRHGTDGMYLAALRRRG